MLPPKRRPTPTQGLGSADEDFFVAATGSAYVFRVPKDEDAEALRTLFRRTVRDKKTSEYPPAVEPEEPAEDNND